MSRNRSFNISSKRQYKYGIKNMKNQRFKLYKSQEEENRKNKWNQKRW